MGLEVFVREAKRNRPVLAHAVMAQAAPAPPLGGGKIIDGETYRSSDNGGEIIPNLSWEKCPNLKQQSARNFCLRFHSFCVKEKCPAKYRRPVSDDGPSLYEKVKRLDV